MFINIIMADTGNNGERLLENYSRINEKFISDIIMRFFVSYIGNILFIIILINFFFYPFIILFCLSYYMIIDNRYIV